MQLASCLPHFFGPIYTHVVHTLLSRYVFESAFFVDTFPRKRNSSAVYPNSKPSGGTLDGLKCKFISLDYPLTLAYIVTFRSVLLKLIRILFQVYRHSLLS